MAIGELQRVCGAIVEAILTDKQLHSLVYAFRKGILGNRSSERLCFAVAAPLQGYLSMLDIKSELVFGDFEHSNHVWLKLSDGRIIDPTADQITTPSGEPMPKVYIGKLPPWYPGEEIV